MQLKKQKDSAKPTLSQRKKKNEVNLQLNMTEIQEEMEENSIVAVEPSKEIKTRTASQDSGSDQDASLQQLSAIKESENIYLEEEEEPNDSLQQEQNKPALQNIMEIEEYDNVGMAMVPDLTQNEANILTDPETVAASRKRYMQFLSGQKSKSMRITKTKKATKQK